MLAWHLEKFGLDGLSKTTITKTKLAQDEVRVRVKACSLNYRDLLVAKGLYNPRQKLPLVLVSDGAGVVEEVGKDAKSFKVGDRVCATFSQNWNSGRVDDGAQKYTLGSPLNGMLSQFTIHKENGLIKFPQHLDFVEASTLPCAALTAFNALVQEACAKIGQTVLLQGTGGVSLFALQFAKALGLKTIITSSSNEKLARAKGLGADYVVNYKENADWDQTVLEITNQQGADVVVEVGGAKTLDKSVASAKRGGLICVIGVLSGAASSLNLIPILMRQVRISGIFVGSRSLFESMNRVIEHAKIRPVVDTVFDFGKSPEAFHHLASAKHFGKVCIRTD